jgi:CRISP-associated protein Cas1
VFVENADTLRGAAIHQRVDSGSGELKMPTTEKSPVAKADAATEASAPETIHSRSVTMGSDRLGVVAKMDLVEVRAAGGLKSEDLAASQAEAELFALEVCPVDYKAGSPKEGRGDHDEGPQLWDTDRMQLGLQALILRENGYSCREGIIYYRGTKQRVRQPIDAELIGWIEGQLADARRVAGGPIPPPLENSPKCARCSLAPVCLPDETRLLAGAAERDEAESTEAGSRPRQEGENPRRLMAPRDDARALYLNTPGLRVGVSGDVLQVKERDKLIDTVRVRDLNHVALFGNIQLSTQAVQTLCEHEVPITYFSMGGWFYGITRGHELKNVFLRKRQFQAADREADCLPVARRMVNGKIRNHRVMLMRNHVEPPPIALRRLKVLAEDALEARGLPELLGLEGAAASLYFENFNGMIKAGDDLAGELNADGQGQLRFAFENRTRRPPTDPVNALLSLAYSMLSKDAAIAAAAVGFDPYIGFYHQPRFGRPALALDLMEEFRPLIAESAVLNAINTRVVTEGDFVRAGKAVNLSAAGRKKFFQTYEQRVTSLVTHPVFDYKVSYRRALELQARILAKTLTGEIGEYVPFTTR